MEINCVLDSPTASPIYQGRLSQQRCLMTKSKGQKCFQDTKKQNAEKSVL